MAVHDDVRPALDSSQVNMLAGQDGRADEGHGKNGGETDAGTERNAHVDQSGIAQCIAGVNQRRF